MNRCKILVICLIEKKKKTYDHIRGNCSGDFCKVCEEAQSLAS